MVMAMVVQAVRVLNERRWCWYSVGGGEKSNVKETNSMGRRSGGSAKVQRFVLCVARGVVCKPSL